MAIPSEPRSIVITGFMGTGKTTTARLLAEALGRTCVDTDALIVERAKSSIADLFAQRGESTFREIEAEVCALLAQQTGLVIATGGGMLISPLNRAQFLRTSVVICLDATPETLEQRLSNAPERPLAGQWRALYDHRREVYALLPYHVSTDHSTPEQTVAEILALLAGILPVDSPNGRYDILVKPGVLRSLAHTAPAFGLDRHTAIITNPTVARLHADDVAEQLSGATLLTMPDGEAYKTLTTMEILYSQMVGAGVDRSTTVLAVGGGVVGDTAGFAAASYMRGVRLVQAPTTLLSMVDSSVGGKVGVDLPEGKNLVGAFKQPAWVLIDPDTLRTLPMREIRCGMAEVIKHGLIADLGLLQDVRALPWAGQGGPNECPTPDMVEGIARLLPRAIGVKVDVVQRDPYEQHERMHLNLGHTFGHAVEQASHYAWPHGESVGIGLIAAALLSQRLGLCGPDVTETTREMTRLAGLPQALGAIDGAAIYEAMAADKKWQAGRSRFVLLEAVGKPKVVEGVAPAEVMAVLHELRGE